MTGRIVSLDMAQRRGVIQDEQQHLYVFHERALKNIQLELLEIGREVTFEDAVGFYGDFAEDIYV